MKFKTAIAAAFAVALSCVQAFGQATLLPPGMQCFSATAGLNGMLGLLGTITGGSLYTNGTYGGVSLTGGSGSGATANITVSGGIVTAVTVLNPGIQYVTGDVLSASAASLGGSGSGFSVPVASTSINSSLAGGSVGFFIPNTQTFKQTWQDAGQTILNQNPVPLDQNGCAVIYGAGIYLMVVQDSLTNTVYSKLTASTSPQGIFFAGTASGTGNAITITDPSFALQDGATIQFRAVASNTGPATISVSGSPPLPIVIDTASGPVALSGSEIDANNMPIVSYDATYAEFHLVNPASSTSGGGGSSAGLTFPQGYLNLVGQASGNVIQIGDVVGTGTIFYSPYIGNTIPIWNGSAFKTVVFSELTATLTSAGSVASAIQDECVFSNNGVPTLVTGPAWSNAAAGAGNRGTGAGSAQITRLQGVWVNANSITGYNGLSSFTIPANQCTYIGSIAIDTTAGQVSAFRSYGQSRKFSVWNAYNRVPINIIAGDSSAAWGYSANVFRAANGVSANSISVFQGLAEEQYDLTYHVQATILVAVGQTASAAIGIGFNSTTAPSGSLGTIVYTTTSSTSVALNSILIGEFIAPPSIGINVVTALEDGQNSTAGTQSFGGSGQSLMQLIARYRG
jgi:hypothetical protein